MVTQAIGEPVEILPADQPDEPQETQGELQVEIEPEDGAAAPEPEGTAATGEDDRVAKLEQQLQETQRKLDDFEKRQQKAQRQRQSDGARAAAIQQQEAEDRLEASRILRASLFEAGVADIDVEKIQPVLDSYALKRKGQWSRQYDTDVAAAAQYVALDTLGGDPDDIPDTAQRFVDAFRPMAEYLTKNAVQLAIQSGEVIAKDALAKHVDAEIARRTEKKPPVKRAGGEPAKGARDLAYWETRIAREGDEGFPYLTGADWNAYKLERARAGLG